MALSGTEWDELCAAAGQLSQQLAAASGGNGSGDGAATRAVPAGAERAAAATAAAAGAAGGAAAGSGGGAAAGAAGGLPLELSSSRRADISNFKGQTFVGIREYYEKVCGVGRGWEDPGRVGRGKAAARLVACLQPD